MLLDTSWFLVLLLFGPGLFSQFYSGVRQGNIISCSLGVMDNWRTLFFGIFATFCCPCLGGIASDSKYKLGLSEYSSRDSHASQYPLLPVSSISEPISVLCLSHMTKGTPAFV